MDPFTKDPGAICKVDRIDRTGRDAGQYGYAKLGIAFCDPAQDAHLIGAAGSSTTHHDRKIIVLFRDGLRQ